MGFIHTSQHHSKYVVCYDDLCSLLLTAKFYSQHSITIATVALVQFYVIRPINTTQDIADVIKTYEMTMGAAYDPLKTMLIPAEVRNPKKPRPLPKHKKAVVSFVGVTYAYDKMSEKSAIDNLSLQIRPSEKLGLIGYSGSGKKTLPN